jgi:anthranilate phosphoribosyltransferase
MVVHGAGGFDEIATAGATLVCELTAEGDIRQREITPADFGLPEADPAGLRGGDPALNAHLLRGALEGAPGAIRQAALMTASAGLVVAGAADGLKDGVARAAEALDRGKALAVLDTLRALTPHRPPQS